MGRFKSKTDDLIKAAEELDSDKIQIRLKALLPRYAPRSFIYVSKDDEFKTYDIKAKPNYSKLIITNYRYG